MTGWNETGNTSAILPNNSMSACGHNYVESSVSRTIKTAAYVGLFLLSLIGNTLVAVIVHRDHRLRTTVNYFIVNMAVSDLLFPIFGIPYRINELYNGYEWLIGGAIGQVLCKVVPYAGDISTAVSTLSLVIIAVDRFDAVVFPMSQQLITNKVRRFLIATTWCISMVYFSPYFYAFKLDNSQNITKCVLQWEPAFDTVTANRNYFFVYFSCFLVLPLIMLVFLFAIIFISLHRQTMSRVLPTEERRRRAKENRRVTGMLLTVVLVFVTSWTPFNVYVFMVHLHHIPPRSCQLQQLVFLSYFLSLTYPGINPLIYFIFNEKYRQGFRKIFSRGSAGPSSEMLHMHSIS